MIVYTCIVGDYDWVLPPVWRSANARFICYTDRPSRSISGWELKPVDACLLGCPPAMINRWYKLLPHEHLPSSEWSLYMDGHIRLISDPLPLIVEAERLEAKMALPIHPFRTSIWEEQAACLAQGKILPDEVSTLESQLRFYKEEGFDCQVPLTENNILLRKHEDPSVVNAMTEWWGQLDRFTKRDQISLPYVLWKSRLPLWVLPYSSKTENSYFRFVAHKKGRSSLASYIQARRYHNLAWHWAYQGVRGYRYLERLMQNVRSGRD